MAFSSCMDVPIFYGFNDDANKWVISIDKYLNVHDIPKTMKVTAAVMALKGNALKWWLWHSQNHPPADWESFKVAFLWHFKPQFRDDLLLVEEEESHPELTILEDEEEPLEQQVEKEPEPEGVEEESEEKRDEEEADSFPLPMVKSSHSLPQLLQNSVLQIPSPSTFKLEISSPSHMLVIMPKASNRDEEIFVEEFLLPLSFWDVILSGVEIFCCQPPPPPKPPDYTLRFYQSLIIFFSLLDQQLFFDKSYSFISRLFHE